MAEEKPTIINKKQPETSGKDNIKPMDILREFAPQVKKVQPSKRIILPGAVKPLPLPVNVVKPPVQLTGQPGSNPFKELPFPSPGDRIKADDFKKLSQSLKVLYDIYQLSSTLFGEEFGDAKLALVSHQYEIQRVMSVFGSEIGSLDEEVLDRRKVIQVLPVELGERQVIVILTEAVETRRTVPSLLGKTYSEAKTLLSSLLSDVTLPSTQMAAPDLIGTSLSGVKTVLK